MGLTAKKALGASKKYTDDQIAQIPGGTVVDTVEDGNMNPVTSNAVYDEAQEIKLSISNLSASVLHTSGNETATGLKTFSDGINSSKGVVGPKASGESDSHVPLELRGSDTEAWLLFSSRLGSGLGYFGSKSDNKPYFYNTEPHELAFKSQIPIVDSVPALNSGNAVSSGGVYAKLQEIALDIADLSASTIVHAEPAISTYFTKKDYVISADIYENTPYVFALPDQHFSFCIMKTWFKAVSGETSGYSHVMLRINDSEFTQERMSAYDDAITVYRDNETGLYMVSISDDHDKYLSFYMELSVINNR